MMNLTPKQSTHIELCESCGCPTGKAGAGEDSLFSEDGFRGPLCEFCSHYEDRVVTPIADENRSLRAERDALRQALKGIRDHQIECVGYKLTCRYLASCDLMQSVAQAALDAAKGCGDSEQRRAAWLGTQVEPQDKLQQVQDMLQQVGQAEAAMANDPDLEGKVG